MSGFLSKYFSNNFILGLRSLPRHLFPLQLPALPLLLASKYLKNLNAPPWDNEGRSVAERLPAEWLPCIYRHHPGLQPNHSPLLTLILNLKQSSFIRLVGSLSSRRRWLPEYNHWVQTSLQCVNFTGFWLGLLPLIGGHPRTENPIDSLSQYCTGSLPARWTR